jgi:hypothetical protein
VGWRDRLELMLGLVVAVIPLVVNVYLFARRKRLMRVKLWRFRLATVGLVLAVVAASITPIFFLALGLPWKMKGEWLPTAGQWAMPVGVMLGLMAAGLLGFGRARVRWLGIAMTLGSLVFLYLNLLGLSD